MAKDNSRKFKQNQICLLYTSIIVPCIFPRKVIYLYFVSAISISFVKAKHFFIVLEICDVDKPDIVYKIETHKMGVMKSF